MPCMDPEALSAWAGSGQPWIGYRILRDLFDTQERDDLVCTARQEMLAHPEIRSLVQGMAQWPGAVLNSHKSAGQLYHRLSFLADIGVRAEDLADTGLSAKLTDSVSSEGLLQLPVRIPVHFGGTGETEQAWALCDTPLLAYNAIRTGLCPVALLRRGIDFLMSLSLPAGGWPCRVSEKLGSFRGPGKKTDPCPYATLLMLKLAALVPDLKDSGPVRQGIGCLLSLWETSRERHPYMFYMGSDFQKLKAPFVWYDLLHLAEVLSCYRDAHSDHRFADMVKIIEDKADPEGRFTPESVWTAWQGWEFAQKKTPSAWLTFLACRIHRRMEKQDKPLPTTPANGRSGQTV